jgi:hypothetical protein
MTERDFDKIFQDKIGDEIPFDFRQNDWLSAEHELNKLLPTAAIKPPASGLLTWHKWAIAATVLLLGSQLYLMSELAKVKQEVVTLHEENTTLANLGKREMESSKTLQNTVIQHDTVVKTVYIETQKGNSSHNNGVAEKATNPFGKNSEFAINNPIVDGEAAVSSASKPTNVLSSKKDNAVQKNEWTISQKPINKIIKETSKNGQKDSFVKQEKAIEKEHLLDNKNNNLIEKNKENSDNLTTINPENKSNLINQNKGELIAENKENLSELKKEIAVLTPLINAQFATIKSMENANNWLNEERFDFKMLSKPVIIKPISEPNSWGFSANALVLANEEHRKPHTRGDHDDQKVSFGANVRLIYALNRKLRLSADVDYWEERHGQFDPLNLPANQPLPNEELIGLNQDARSVQLRLGADYKLRQVIGLQPFIGVGIAFQKRLNDDLEFKYKKNNIELPPISTPNDDKFNKPISLSLRVGVEGKLYRRLGWSIDINAQGGMRNSQALSTHFGLKYAL